MNHESNSEKVQSNGVLNDTTQIKADIIKISKKYEFFDQFKALMYRNFIIKKRNQVSSLFEIILPLFAIITMILIQQLHFNDSKILEKENLQLSNGKPYERYSQIQNFYKKIRPSNKSLQDLIVGIAPKSSFANMFKECLSQTFAVNSSTRFKEDQIRMFDSDKDIDKYVSHFDHGRKGYPALIAAIVFENTTTKNLFKYKIRMATKRRTFIGSGNVPETNGEITDKISVSYDSKNQEIYLKDGFLLLQELVDNFIIDYVAQKQSPNLQNNLSNNSSNFVFLAQPFPVPKHQSAKFQSFINLWVGLIFSMFWLYTVNRVIKSLVEEKEHRIKEHMKSMGLNQSVLTLSWFLTYTIIFFLIALITIIISPTSLYKHSNKGIIYSFYFLFGLCIFAFCFMMSAFFNTANLAGTVATIIFQTTFFAYFAVNSPTKSSTAKYSSCLSLSVCLALGVTKISQFEARKIGITRSTFQTVTNNYSLAGCFGMIALDFAIYGILGQYLNQIIPSTYGTRQPQYFLFQPSYQSKKARRNKAKHRRQCLEQKELLANENQDILDTDTFEPVAESLNNLIGVSVKKLRKVQGGKNLNKVSNVAVNDLSIDLFYGQILSFLGENGAGKTTTINMLTGFCEPTSGDAFILDSSITTDIDSIRKYIGICPQHDIIYPILTVREHLKLYASIKGVQESFVNEEVNKIIKDCDLLQKADTQAGNLSGGMKRKLMLAISFIGQSKIVFLDEPTSGMDPYSRRKTWDFIKSQRKNRVIVLTTHYMDEADYLGDRIAIISQGVLKCWGTSLFLKNCYGVGYTMTLTKRKSLDKDNSSVSRSNSKNENQIEFVRERHYSEPKEEYVKEDSSKEKFFIDPKSYVLENLPDSKLLTDIGSELTFRLTFESSCHFPQMFEYFDENMHLLGLENYGISATTLEEVFLRVSNIENKCNLENVEYSKGLLKPVEIGDKKYENVEKEISDTEHKNENWKNRFNVFFRHLKALLTIRLLTTYRDQKPFFVQYTFSLLVLLLGIGLVSIGFDSNFHNLVMDSSLQFDRPNVISYARGYDYNQTNNTYDIQYMNKYLKSNVDKSGYEGTPYLRIPNPTSLKNFQKSLLQNLDSNFLTENSEQKGKSQYQALFFGHKMKINNKTNESLVDVLIFNTTAAHSLPVTLNLYNNLRGRLITSLPDFKIEMSSHPFPLSALDQDRFNSITGILIGIACSYIPSYIVAKIVRERSSKQKHQLLVSGTNLFSYQFSFWIQDVLIVLSTMIVMVIILVGYNVTGLISGENFVSTSLLLIFYTLSIVPFSYLFSFLFNNSVIAQNLYQSLLSLGRAILTIVQIVLQSYPNLVETNKVLVYFQSIIPNFTISQAFVTLFVRNSVLSHKLNVQNWQISQRAVILLVIESVVYTSLVFIIEYIRVNKILSKRKFIKANSMNNTSKSENSVVKEYEIELENKEKIGFEIDEDVVKEAQRACNMKYDKEPVILKRLRKVYKLNRLLKSKNEGSNIVAVHNLSFGVPDGQIFGFLGVNGAGKTTSLKMLTGDIMPTSGLAYLNGYNIINEQNQIRQNIGYCPQFDALFDHLTAREHLKLYNRLRSFETSLTEKDCQIIDELIEKVGLSKFADQISSKYSGGNKRKLSLAIAMIGEPKIVFLDEPSTGMDPASRRLMQNYILLSKEKRCVILTTHSMEECQSLCSKLAIMSQGELMCIGTPQHLKNKFGSGYLFDVNLVDRENEDLDIKIRKLKEFVSENFPDSVLFDHLSNNLKFTIKRSNEYGTLARIFRLIEENKVYLHIKEYSVSGTTLEQIFIQFARQKQFQ